MERNFRLYGWRSKTNLKLRESKCLKTMRAVARLEKNE